MKMPHTASELAAFCKKKGFIYPSSEIYGGVAGLYDYGHLGTRLKRNFENLWRQYFLGLDDNYVEIETAAIMHEKVFEASGHLEKFADIVAYCKKCGFKERADHLVEKNLKSRAEGFSVKQLSDIIKENKLKCPHCSSGFSVFPQNMMFPVQLGSAHKEAEYADGVPARLKANEERAQAYLRPETAQGPYVNFKLQYELQRKKMPLGLALIGRAYRNEISPRNLTLRQREFTQAELQIFFNPSRINEHKEFNLIKNYALRIQLVKDREKKAAAERTAEELVNQGWPQFYVYHLVRIQQFYLQQLQVPAEKFRFSELDEKEKAFYNKYHFDIEVEVQELGWTEVGGLHYRTDHDLAGHQQLSGERLEVLEEQSGHKYIPHVLELSFGVDRNVYALLDLNYEYSKERDYIILHLPARLAPFYCAVFPLVKNKPELVLKAEEVQALLRKEFSCLYDESGAVGRRYARADEMGVRWCLTVDFDSLGDNAVTIRDRETTRQERVKIAAVVKRLSELRQSG